MYSPVFAPDSSLRNGRALGQWPPRKGRPAALAVSPFPDRASDAREGGRREAPQGVALYLGARMAIVRREMQVISPASFTISICHTCVVRPRCTGRAVPVTQPLVAARR